MKGVQSGQLVVGPLFRARCPGVRIESAGSRHAGELAALVAVAVADVFGVIVAPKLPAAVALMVDVMADSGPHRP